MLCGVLWRDGLLGLDARYVLTPITPRAHTVTLCLCFSLPKRTSILNVEQHCVTVTSATTAQDMTQAAELFREYADSLGLDLAFQNFNHEIAHLPGEYAPPRGSLLLAYVDHALAGCCALRPLDTFDTPNAAEMKRLYVRKAFRGFGLGRQLAEATLDAARQAGYACVLLDTLDDMEAARNLYTDLGFEETTPYYHNPIGGAHYLKAVID